MLTAASLTKTENCLRRMGLPLLVVLVLQLRVVSGDAYTWTADMPHGNASVEYRLKQFLMRGYDITSRPVRLDATAIDCKLGMSLFHILDTSERHQTVSALMSLRVHWRDEYIRWNRSEYQIEKIWIPARSIWRPDLIITNYANDEYSDYINTNAIVDWTGKVMWTFPIVVKMYCTLDVRYFPFDTQDCNVTFMSWTYDGFRLGLNHTGREDQKVYYEPRNQEWMVTTIVPFQENRIYPCCPEPFPVLHFTIHMYRRCLFYVINLICPCLLIYCVSFLGFFLPIESGEKVNLEITVLLALVVFLLMVSENMPPTPDAVPVVGLLFSVTMIMVALAVVMAVTVTFVFFAQPHSPPPACALRLARFYRRWRRRPAATAAAATARRHMRAQQQQQHQQQLYHLQQQQQQQHILCGGSVGGRLSGGGGSGGAIDSDDDDHGIGVGGGGCSDPAAYFKETLRAAVAANVANAAAAANGSCKSLPLPAGRPQNSLDDACGLLAPPRQKEKPEKNEDDFADEWRAAAFALDWIFFWAFLFLTCLMFSMVAWVAWPAFTVEHPTGNSNGH